MGSVSSNEGVEKGAASAVFSVLPDKVSSAPLVRLVYVPLAVGAGGAVPLAATDMYFEPVLGSLIAAGS